MKLTKRKGFNFYRSYYDVFNELEDDAKLQFITALLDKEFLGVNPQSLTGMAKFAYISQVNSIEAQVKGYEDKTKTKLTPTEGGAQGESSTPTGQEKEKEKEEEKEHTTTKEAVVDFNLIDLWIVNLKNETIYLEGLYRLYKLKQGSISKIILKFKEHLKIYPKQHKDISDFKKHFASWVRLKINNKELTEFCKHQKGEL